MEARDKFLHGNPVSLRSIIAKINDGYQAREWLVANVKGIGCKEARHFLRNIGFYQDLAILDRHILKNLKKLGVIDGVPVDPLIDCEDMVASWLRNLDTPHLRA